ncbi:MAG: hypothetical protein ABI919_00740 [Ramlibacter sp.]
MPESRSSTPQVPPEVARYLKGAPPESHQFDFLIGEWDVNATRFKEDGTPLFEFRASWSAVLLNEGRMVMDDFKALAPTGQPVSSYVTLRTYSEVSQRWEMTGLQALQPSASTEWGGVCRNGEMLLDVTGKDPAGNPVHTKIRFFDISTNSFSWESSMSRDEGKSWSKTAVLLAARVLKQL